MIAKMRMIYCESCGRIYRKVFYEGNRFEIECNCGNVIGGEI